MQQDQKTDKEELERIKRLIESGDKDDFSIKDDKSNLQTFQSNSIQSVELTTEGDLKINYSNSNQPTSIVKPTSNPNLQKIANSMKKNNQTKLTKAELEQQLRELEEQKKKLEGGEEQKDKGDGLGLKIGIGALVVVVLVSLVVVLVRKNKRKKY